MRATRGWRQRQVVLVAVRLDELVLDDPVELAVELERVVLEAGEAVLPHAERLLLERRQALGLGVAQRPVEVLGLDVEGRHLAAVGQAHRARAGEVVADLADGPDRVLERHVAQHDDGSSSMRSRIDVAPTLRNVAYSLMFESPTMTWSRR